MNYVSAEHKRDAYTDSTSRDSHRVRCLNTETRSSC